jgi:allophanate hydrolase
MNQQKKVMIQQSLLSLLDDYRQHMQDPKMLLPELLKAARQDQHRCWISLIDDQQLSDYLARLEGESPDTLPLYGIPFAIKDNIDLQGLPTTAACAAFSYLPEESATVVKLLIAAGAIPLGKTNMDQFATGLVGVRSPAPWGACRNSLNPEMISGGSSSGSAVAVALGQVCFSLGTDTAGSGRVPAAFNNIVGLKPSKGLLSTQGVIPACASLDCVSIFAFTSEDANHVLNITAQFDADNLWSRKNPYSNGPRYFNPAMATFSFAVPREEQLVFFGDQRAQAEFNQACQALEKIGGRKLTLDFSCLFDAAKLLYQGPWVAERYLAIQNLLESQPDSLHPVIRQIVEPAKKLSALQTFSAQYQLQAFKQQADALLEQADVFVTPTAGTCYQIEQVEADPVQLNSNLGYYTNFMNLLDLAAIATPTGFLDSGVGFGITLFSAAMRDKTLLSLSAKLQQSLKLTPGTLTSFQNPPAANSPATLPPKDKVQVIVCGAHLQGLPLNWQLTERDARFIEKTRSATGYRLYALAGGPPLRPGMVVDHSSDQDIEIEIWELPMHEFGSFVAAIPAPLGIGKVKTADGRELPGFICEASGLQGAEDITRFGGWRNWLASR